MILILLFPIVFAKPETTGWGGAMSFMDHGLPAEVAGGTLSSASVVWNYKRGNQELQFHCDIGHELTVVSDGNEIASFSVGDPAKVTTSRRTVENVIRKYLKEG
jgi:hypothetical protein